MLHGFPKKGESFPTSSPAEVSIPQELLKELKSNLLFFCVFFARFFLCRVLFEVHVASPTPGRGGVWNGTFLFRAADLGWGFGLMCG